MPTLSHPIPDTPWRAKGTWALRPRMITPLVAGLALFGVVGVGTAFFAGTIGFSIGLSLSVLDRMVTRSPS